MKIDTKEDIVVYAFEPEDFNKLLYIEKALYGNGTHLTSDARRDLANLLNYLLHHLVIPLSKGDSI
jgi:hypothetical protein